MSRGEVEGWAQDATDPERPVRLEIVADGVAIGDVVANRYRRDLEDAGIGSGRHAFRLRLPELPGRAARRIDVRRAVDLTPLPGSPVLLEPAPG